MMASRRDKLNDALGALTTMSLPELRREWTRMTGQPAPRVSAVLLRLALAYELQAKALGRLPLASRLQLEQTAPAQTRTCALAPGMRLVREWHGDVHVVTIGEAGEIRWKDREWRSLSEVARAITGTRWSGPAFFGLREKRRAA